MTFFGFIFIKMLPSPFLFPTFYGVFVPKITCLAAHNHWYVWEAFLQNSFFTRCIVLMLFPLALQHP